MPGVRAIETASPESGRIPGGAAGGTKIANGVAWIGWTDREVTRSTAGPPPVFGSAHGARLLELLQQAG